MRSSDFTVRSRARLPYLIRHSQVNMGELACLCTSRRPCHYYRMSSCKRHLPDGCFLHTISCVCTQRGSDRMPTRLPGLTGVNGIRLPIRGGKQGGTRVPGLRVFSSLGPSEEVRLNLNTFQPTRRSLEASHSTTTTTTHGAVAEQPSLHNCLSRFQKRDELIGASPGHIQSLLPRQVLPGRV